MIISLERDPLGEHSFDGDDATTNPSETICKNRRPLTPSIVRETKLLCSAVTRELIAPSWRGFGKLAEKNRLFRSVSSVTRERERQRESKRKIFLYSQEILSTGMEGR